MSKIERDPYIHVGAEKLRRLGVKALLFDLDDTLIDTDYMFMKHMTAFADDVAHGLGLDPYDVFKRLREINNEEYGIKPQKWLVVLDRLGKELGNPELVMSGYFHIEKIYFEEPHLLPGVGQILSGLREEGFLLGEVTHGETDWSIRKNEQTGLINYMDAIVTASVNGPKSKEHWLQGMEMLSVSPDECVITGDSIKGDIIPAIELGARAVSIPSPWSVYRQGEIPQGAVTIDRIADFWDAVADLCDVNPSSSW